VKHLLDVGRPTHHLTGFCKSEGSAKFLLHRLDKLVFTAIKYSKNIL
jgi:hypothetical protein